MKWNDTKERNISVGYTRKTNTHTHIFALFHQENENVNWNTEKYKHPNNDINYVCIKRVVGGKVDLFINKYVSKNLRVHVFPVLHLLHRFAIRENDDPNTKIAIKWDMRVQWSW